MDSLGADVVDGGLLSKLQLEGVSYACQKHLEILPDGARAGFMIGDGAGVGKGRQIGGIILDNYARGRRKHLWISSSSDLRRDATRDLRDLGCHLKVIDGCQELDRETRAAGLSSSCAEGVLFLTYATLVSKTARRSRLDQILEWFGGASADGCVCLDECHKAKNFNAQNDQGSKVAACVIELQTRCPDARVVYCSATGISEIGNMAYMRRLGFWGRGTPFQDADAFISAMRNRGVGFLEMLAMEMKASGKYVSRGLSFRAAEFATLEATLTPEQVARYDEAALFMSRLRACTAEAAQLTRREKSGWQKAYWSVHQRFFKLLCVSMKTPAVVRLAKEALSRGNCVVIGLQTTGESAESALGLTPGTRVSGFASTTREMLAAFVENHFPTTYPDVGVNDGISERRDPDGIGISPHANVHDSRAPSRFNVAARSAAGATLAVNEECAEAKAILLRHVRELDLPVNFLDELIDELGGASAVAEMTGRRGRIVRAPGDGGGAGVLRYEARGDSLGARGRDAAAPGSIASDGDVEGVNLREKAAFNDGSKLVAIISDAASTGISLHASRGAKNQRRRTHVTIELPWSADKAIQQLGRTHRSNQIHGPSYVVCSTNLGGERRFAAAVARRLQSLGALTRGDRRAATGIDLSEGNLDSPLGRKALKKMYDALLVAPAEYRDGRDGAPRAPRALLANGVPLEAVLKHLPRPTERADGARADDETAADPDCPSEKSSSWYLDLERARPGAGVAALCAELRELVVSLGVNIGLSPAGLPEELRRALAADAPLRDQQQRDSGDVRRFLNRVLGLPVRGQNLLFGYFTETLAAEVKLAKAEGKYSEGVSDLSGSNIRIESSSVLVRDPFGSGAELRRTSVLIDRGVRFEEALAALRERRRERDATNRPVAAEQTDENNLKTTDRDGFYRMRRDMYGRAQVILACAKPGLVNTFAIMRPNTGVSFFEMDAEELDRKYRRVPDEHLELELKPHWDLTYAMTERSCVHGAQCERGPRCASGSRATRCCIVSGAVVPAWGVLERVLERNEHLFNKSDRGMRAVKVTAEDGTKVVGVRYPEDLLPEVRERVANEWVMRDDQENEADARERAKEGGGGMRGGEEKEGTAGEEGTGTRRGRVDAPTPVDAKFAARAKRAPATLLTFFGKRGGEGAEGVEETDATTKRARPLAEVAEVAEARRQPPPPSTAVAGAGKTVWGKATKKSERKPTRVETATCPICGRGFSATALNSDINAHVDACMNAMANE